MIIFIGGLIGAGKSSTARAIAEHYSFYYYELDEVKRDIYARYPETERCFAEGTLVDLNIRRQTFEHAAGELPQLVKAHRNVVMDEVFHVREFRHIVFDAAEALDQPYIFVWVHTTEQTVVDRLSAKQREGHILHNPLPMRRAMAEEFEDFNRSVLYCANNGKIEDSVADLTGLIDRSAALARPLA